ncbi:MAG: hypothetical protein A2173_08785 [Planctomycetes bacterium RBG_13_44_8b]|nr:MAG: hypothetical protein A2173_08785 [Planctomycetes bacterium RBG_13_44_8b]
MKTKSLFVAVMLLYLATQSRATAYTAIDLTPSGFTGSVGKGVGGTQQAGSGSGSATNDETHALLWNGSAANYVDLHPSGFSFSAAYGINGNQQVGSGSGSATNDNQHALLWSGTADSYIDSNPSGFSFSSACGTNGTQQIGQGYGSATNNNQHALLWSGTAASYVDLHPTSGFSYSVGQGISDTYQVGYGLGSATNNKTHALLWSGTADSCIDLTPSKSFSSRAYGAGGNQQVGWGYDSTIVIPAPGGPGSGSTNPVHALLWSGTADSCVDLNPSSGFSNSGAYGTNGTQQVGYGYTDSDNQQHALLWSGTADSYIDLHQFLPAGFTDSLAYAIDSSGNVVGYAYDSSSGSYHAILWQPAPEPATICLFGLAGLILRRRKWAFAVQNNLPD